MRAPRYVGNNFPFAALDALTDVAVHQYGPQHLTRGGPAGRARAAMARGATPVVAAAVATPQGKGHVGEVHVAASHSLYSGLFGEGYHSQPNANASHPHEDIHVLLGNLIANNAQIGVGSPRYLARKAMASNANQVVGNSEALTVLREAADPAYALLQDHMRHEATRSAVLTEEKTAADARVILERLLLEEAAVPFAKGCGSFATAENPVILGAWIATSRLRVRRDGNCRSSNAAATGTGTSLGAGFLVEKRLREPPVSPASDSLDEPKIGGATDRNCSRFAPS